MSLLKRLDIIRMGQTTAPHPPRPRLAQFPDRIVVTITEPVRVSEPVLLPGRYVYRLLNLGTDRNVILVFKEDSTELVAALPEAGPLNNGEGETGIADDEEAAGHPEAVWAQAASLR